MNAAKGDDLDDTHFLIAAPKAFTCTEAAGCQPESPSPHAHDALHPPAPKIAFRHQGIVAAGPGAGGEEKGLLVLDDTTANKPSAKKMERVTYHWRGKHHGGVKSMSLLTLLTTDGVAPPPLRLSGL